MRFHDCSTAPSPRRARIFIAEKGLDIPTVEVNLREGEHLRPTFRALNPRCTVPVLELDDGTCLWETLAICDYLESIHPEPRLMGRTPLERAQVLQWHTLIDQDGFSAVGEYFRNHFPGFRGRALTGTETVDQIPALVERGQMRAAAFFRMLDVHLKSAAHVCGEPFSLADISAVVALDFAARLKLVPDGLVHLAAWRERMEVRPATRL